ncbi:uncharacterized protein LOC141642435 [Silene latifolia]|uniref:uncharacterized protein LOC141642435 n=1 Tax=Silene latifolia TaxID=37657 RepID=UPI003D786B90
MASTAAAITTINPSCRTLIDDNDDDTLFPSQQQHISQLSTSSHLTRQELLRRRLIRTRKLSRVYRDHFWTLMDHLRAQYRQYYWNYGVSPLCFDTNTEANVVNNNGNAEFGVVAEGCGETNAASNINAADHGSYCCNGKLGLGLGYGEGGSSNNGGAGGYRRCAFSACELKAMALTSFCSLHILSDPNQKLYKPCNFVIKAPEQGQIICGRPILSSAVPSLCNSHLPKALNDVKQALKKAGLTAAASGRLSSKFHVVVAEYVQLIQSRRRAAQKRDKKKIIIKEESSN